MRTTYEIAEVRRKRRFLIKDIFPEFTINSLFFNRTPHGCAWRCQKKKEAA
jgi:hypothetical protein